MYAPARAILWHLARRYRWGHYIVAAYFLAAIVLSHTIPPDPRILVGREFLVDGASSDNQQTPPLGWVLGFPSIWVMIFVVSVFSLAGRTTGDSGFTTHTFILPVRTGTLVTWLMAGGCLAVTVVWIAAACLILRPAGVAAPIWWPAATAAVLLAWFQVLSWTPFAQRWLQMVLTVIAITVPFLVLGFVLLRADGLAAGEPMIALVMLSLIAPAYIAARSGVARARRGDVFDLRIWNRFLKWLSARQGPAGRPFASPRRAQLWFECRAHGWFLPVFVGSLQVWIAVALLIEPGDVALSWRLLGMLLGGPVLIATIAGNALGNLHDPFSKSDSGAFVLSRPISTLSLVRGKFVTAAVGTVATWLLVLATVPLLLLRPGFFVSVREFVQSVPAWKAAILSLSAVALLVALTWKSIIESLWITLTGRAWVKAAISIGFIVLLFCGGSAGSWIYFHPQLHAAVWAAVPWIIGLLLLGKLIVAAIVLRSLDRSGLIGMQTAAALGGVWGLVVVGLYLIACWLTPSQLWSASGTLAAVVLFVPFSRLVGAPVALEWNRHR